MSARTCSVPPSGNFRFTVLIFVFFVGFLMPASVYSAVPATMNYQGHLADSGGNAVSGVVDITFTLYTTPTGASNVWSETHTGMNISGGLFSAELGGTNPLSGLGFDIPYYLGITIGSDPEMFPRQPLSSSPYAFKAVDADMVGGVSAASLDQSGDLATHVGDTGNPHNVTAAQVGAASSAAISSAITTHAGIAAAHHAKTTSFTELNDQIGDAQIPAAITRDVEVYTQAQVDALLATRDTQISTLQGQITVIQTLLTHFSRTGNDIYITGANLHVVDGSGDTSGAVNSLGNLIVGYNELRGGGDDRSGSHNLILGERHNYSSYGGLVAGHSNTISGLYASVSGGSSNTASGSFASVSGGTGNTASFPNSSVSGGQNNTASGSSASISGGLANTASGSWSSVSGGGGNTASGSQATVSGGQGNTSSGSFASVSAGRLHTASGTYASVSGGESNIASGYRSSISGGANNSAMGDYASVSGGRFNQASGLAASVAGGGGATSTLGNVAFANYSAILGGRTNLSGDQALVNHTLGENSTVSGGDRNIASGTFSSVSGGANSIAGGIASSVSGGVDNIASGGVSSVSGGIRNTAGGSWSSVSGGTNRSVTGSYDWRAGGLFETQ